MDELLLSFFQEASSALLQIGNVTSSEDAKQKQKTTTTNKDDDDDNDVDDSLSICRRQVLNVQQSILQQQIDKLQPSISIDQAIERLRGLKQEPDLSPKLQQAMEEFDESARLALCKLVMYAELNVSSSSSNKKTIDDGDLDRTKLLEYFGLCQTALKLHCVKKFMVEGGSLFDDLPQPPSNKQLLFPQTRLEHVQQILARAMGWDPEFLTIQLRRIFVEKDESIELVHDEAVSTIFQQLVQQMQTDIRTASLQMQNQQQAQLLSDIDEGGTTRVVSVSYSEYDISPDGTKQPTGNHAPTGQLSSTIDSQRMTEEEKKRQIRLASEAAMLQQEILGQLLNMSEHERNDQLQEAERVSEEFMKRAMQLPPGQERIDFLRSIDPHTSKQLAMHNLWKGTLDANGGRPPKMVSRCNH
jgi:hypothetical protein